MLTDDCNNGVYAASILIFSISHDFANFKAAFKSKHAAFRPKLRNNIHLYKRVSNYLIYFQNKYPFSDLPIKFNL